MDSDMSSPFDDLFNDSDQDDGEFLPPNLGSSSRVQQPNMNIRGAAGRAANPAESSRQRPRAEDVAQRSREAGSEDSSMDSDSGSDSRGHQAMEPVIRTLNRPIRTLSRLQGDRAIFPRRNGSIDTPSGSGNVGAGSRDVYRFLGEHLFNTAPESSSTSRRRMRQETEEEDAEERQRVARRRVPNAGRAIRFYSDNQPRIGTRSLFGQLDHRSGPRSETTNEPTSPEIVEVDSVESGNAARTNDQRAERRMREMRDARRRRREFLARPVTPPPPPPPPEVVPVINPPPRRTARATPFDPVRDAADDQPRPLPRIRTQEVINLVNDSSDDDDDFHIVGANINAPAPPFPPVRRTTRAVPARAQVAPNFAQDIQAIEGILEDRRRRVEAIVNDQADDRRRAVLSPPGNVAAPEEPPRRPVVRLGGAVLQAGGRQLRFNGAQRQPDPEAQLQAAVRANLRHRAIEPDLRNPPERRLRNLRNNPVLFQMDDEPVEPPAALVPPAARRRGFMERLGNALLGRREAEEPAQLAGAYRPLVRDFGGAVNPQVQELMNALRGGPAERAALINGMMFGDGAGAGPGPGRHGGDIQAIIAEVGDFNYPDLPNDFTSDFDADNLKKSPIQIDDNGKIIPPETQPYHACANCTEPLLLSANYRSNDDKVWVLRCGHMIDQRCLNDLSTPTTGDQLATILPRVGPVLGAAPEGKNAKARKQARRSKKSKEPPKEYFWKCPVTSCRKLHCSLLKDGAENWEQKDGKGALQAFM